jgi:hypothetical protein
MSFPSLYNEKGRIKMQIQLLGQPVKHISFGKGIVTDISNKTVTIRFEQEEKKFLFPQAFSRFLTLNDTTKQREISEKYNGILQAEKAEKIKKSEEQEQRRRIYNMKIMPNSQAVFDIKVNEVESIVECGSIETGYYISGYSKGEPRIPKTLKPNSVCLLTGLPNNCDERNRTILGAFMVKESFWGEDCKNGLVEGHKKYKVCLAPNTNLLYWNYFDECENIPRWGNVRFKYLSNSIMQKILFDMTKIFLGTKQESNIYEFYQHFSEINHLPLLRTITE